jgi:hypothetical protein
MVDITVPPSLVRMTIQTISRIGTCGYCVNDFLTRTVMTGSAGTGTIGVNIVFSSLYFSPVVYNMTFTAELAIGKIVGTYCNCMCMT